MASGSSEDTAACYYDSVYILKKAIEKAKSTKPADIAKAMEGLEYEGYAGWLKVRSLLASAHQESLSHGLHGSGQGRSLLAGHRHRIHPL